jgi:hypothetical protein
MNLSFFKNFFSLKTIKKPFFIGTLVAIMLSIAPIAYMIVELNNKKVVYLVANFLNKSSGLEWKSFKSFTWGLLPAPSLKWQQIELKDKTQKGSIYIKELSMRLSASQLLNGVIYVKNLSISGIAIKINESIENTAELLKIIFNLEKKIDKDKETFVAYLDRYKDLKLSENFIFNPYIIDIKNASISQINNSENKNYNFYDTNLTLTKQRNDQDILQLALINIQSKLLVNDLEVTLAGSCMSHIDNHNGIVFLHKNNLNFITSKEDQKANINLSGNIEYSYKNNFLQSDIKAATKNIQELAFLFNLNIPKKINNTDFDYVSLAATIIYKDSRIKSNNIKIQVPEFNLQGTFNYNPLNKKIFANLNGSGLIFDEFYQEYHPSEEYQTTDNNDKQNGILNIIKSMNLVKYIPNKNLHLVYSPRYFQWHNIRLNKPKLELKTSHNKYYLTYESDINSGKIDLTSQIQHLGSSIKSNINCNIIALDIGESCSNIDVCKKSQGDIDLTSNIDIKLNKTGLTASGIAEANIKNLIITNIDIDYTFLKLINAAVNKEIEYNESIAKTHFNKMKAKVTLENKKLNIFNIEAYTKKSKVLGNGIFNIQSDKAKIRLKIFPLNNDFFYSSEYPGEFHDMFVPLICHFSNGKWNYRLDKNKFKNYLQTKNLNSKLIEKILNIDLLY